MSKKSIGTGITRLLFGLKGKDLKVIPFNEMTPQQFEQLDSFLGKVGFLLASDTFTLTKRQSDYVINQIFNANFDGETVPSELSFRVVVKDRRFYLFFLFSSLFFPGEGLGFLTSKMDSTNKWCPKGDLQVHI